MPSVIRGNNIEEVINEWNGELEKQSQAFIKHASKCNALLACPSLATAD
jgi:hypothetical protein